VDAKEEFAMMVGQKMQNSLFSDPFRLIYRSRLPLWVTLVDEIKRRYAGSVFGMAWLLILPLLFLSFYATVYLVVFRVKPPDMTPFDYVLYVYIGLMPFLSFSESMGSGAGSLASNKAVLLNAVFPAELLPLRTVLAAQSTFAVGISIAVVWALLTGRLNGWIFLLPVIIAAHVMFLVGVSWFLSPIYLVFRDLGQLLNFVVLAMLVVSPIAYRADALSGVPALLLHLNPLYYFLNGYQSVIFDGKPPDPVTFGICLFMSAATFTLGFAFCHRAKLVFADYA
jgi:lipopolysaccharide transport system permease protein